MTGNLIRCKNHSNKTATEQMTIRQERMIQELEKPETKSIRQAALKAGYKEGYADGSIHLDLRKPSNKVGQYLAKRYSKEGVDKDLRKIEKLAEDKIDLSNWLRSIELRSKIAKLFNDNTLQQINVVSGVFSDEDKAKLLAKGIPQ